MTFYIVLFLVSLVLLGGIFGRKYYLLSNIKGGERKKKLVSKFFQSDIAEDLNNLTNNELETLAGSALDNANYESAIKYLIVLEKRAYSIISPILLVFSESK